jgi:hypothetical protein
VELEPLKKEIAEIEASKPVEYLIPNPTEAQLGDMCFCCVLKPKTDSDLKPGIYQICKSDESHETYTFSKYIKPHLEDVEDSHKFVEHNNDWAAALIEAGKMVEGADPFYIIKPPSSDEIEAALKKAFPDSE